MEYIQEFKERIQHQVGQDINITFEFFIVFSRVEFALKHSEYAKPDKSKNAMADWDRFTDVNEHAFQIKLADMNNTALIEASNYLFNTPPKRLKLIANELNWENRDVIENRSFKELTSIIRGIRNNLFHGSKQLNIKEYSRDWELLNYGLIILNECLIIDTNVRLKFLEELG